MVTKGGGGAVAVGTPTLGFIEVILRVLWWVFVGFCND